MATAMRGVCGGRARRLRSCSGALHVWDYFITIMYVLCEIWEHMLAPPLETVGPGHDMTGVTCLHLGDPFQPYPAPLGRPPFQPDSASFAALSPRAGRLLA